jgi:hypothetical protein
MQDEECSLTRAGCIRVDRNIETPLKEGIFADRIVLNSLPQQIKIEPISAELKMEPLENELFHPPKV